jgi:hypothetical protein
VAFIDYANTDLPATGSTGGKCPKCKDELTVEFGLAGGGYGTYEFCDNCSVVVTKDVESEDTDGEPRE